MNGLYLSTGAFIGRVNGRNWHLLTRNHDKLRCDGFEFMIFESFYGILDEIIAEYKAEAINIPVVHTMKTIGDYMSDPKGMAEAERLVLSNCEAAVKLGATKIVVHCWGKPLSDGDFDMISERIGILREKTAGYGIDFLPENSFCVHGSPYEHFRILARRYPGIGFTLDTRCAEFHGELEAFGSSGLWKDGNIRHLHINDYLGGYKDWNAMYPIPQPGQGQIKWESFFGDVRNNGYTGSVTLEAPAMLEDGVNTAVLNGSLDFIRESLTERKKINGAV